MAADGEEIISFIDGPFVVVMSGTGLEFLYDAIHRCTLRAVYEYDGRPMKEGDPVIRSLAIDGPDPKEHGDNKQIRLVTKEAS